VPWFANALALSNNRTPLNAIYVLEVEEHFSSGMLSKRLYYWALFLMHGWNHHSSDEFIMCIVLMIDNWYENDVVSLEIMVLKEFQGKFFVMVILVYALT